MVEFVIMVMETDYVRCLCGEFMWSGCGVGVLSECAECMWGVDVRSECADCMCGVDVGVDVGSGCGE